MVIYTSYTLLSGHLIDNCQEVAKGQPWKAIEVYKMDDSFTLLDVLQRRAHLLSWPFCWLISVLQNLRLFSLCIQWNKFF